MSSRDATKPVAEHSRARAGGTVVAFLCCKNFLPGKECVNARCTSEHGPASERPWQRNREHGVSPMTYALAHGQTAPAVPEQGSLARRRLSRVDVRARLNSAVARKLFVGSDRHFLQHQRADQATERGCVHAPGCCRRRNRLQALRLRFLCPSPSGCPGYVRRARDGGALALGRHGLT